MKDILCSIIVFVENDSFIKSLPTTVKSIQRQDIENYEVILTSDMSLSDWKGNEIIPFKNALKKIKGRYVFFISSDTVLSDSSLKNMLLSLERDEHIGAAGPIINSSYFISQNLGLGEAYSNIAEMNDCFAKWQERHPDFNKQTMHLDDNCLLISSEVLREVGLPDSNLPGSWSADICLRILQAGYSLKICSQAYAHCNRLSPSIPAKKAGAELFYKKWGFNYIYSMDIRDKLLGMASFDESNINVLDLGCSCGGNLMKIHSENPTAQLYGIELNSMAARIARNWGEVLAEDLDVWDDFSWHGKFDIVIMGDILEHLRDTSAILKKVNSWLKPGGKLLLSVPNIMHISIIKSLIMDGKWSYREEGILDRTHLRFFTRKEIIKRLQENGFAVRKITFTQSYVDSDMQECMDLLLSGKKGNVVEEDYRAFQWLLLSEKKKPSPMGRGDLVSGE